MVIYVREKPLAARLLMLANEFEQCKKDGITVENVFKFVSPLFKGDGTYDEKETIIFMMR